MEKVNGKIIHLNKQQIMTREKFKRNEEAFRNTAQLGTNCITAIQSLTKIKEDKPEDKSQISRRLGEAKIGGVSYEIMIGLVEKKDKKPWKLKNLFNGNPK
jgi:hypothetical protein